MIDKNKDKCTEHIMPRLTGCDLTTAQGSKKYKEQQAKEKKGVRYVSNSMKTLLQITKE